MIRPFTLVCALLAVGSGLYLYQTKHRAQLLDRQIRQIREATDALREHGGVLRAEYALLNDPQRLADLASAHLPELKPTQPQQWSVMAELDKRLPAVGDATAAPSPLEPPVPGAAPPAEAAPAPAPVAALPIAAVPIAASPVAQAAPPAPHPLAARAAARPALVALRPAPAPRPPAPAQIAAGPPPTPRLATAQIAPRMAPQPVLQPTPLAASSLGRLMPSAYAAAPAYPPAPTYRSPPAYVAAPAYQPAPAYRSPPAYAAPPGTAAEAIARIAHGAPVDPSVPVVASALGMARSMVPGSPVAPASAAMLYTLGAPR